MEAFLIPVFALLNRWRGSDWPVKWAPFVAKILSGFILGALFWRLTGWESVALVFTLPAFFILYWAGESWIDGIFHFGWAEHLSAIVQKRYTDKNALMLFFRGVEWWLPCFVPFFFVGVPIIPIVAATIVAGSGFPVAFIVATRLNITDKNWELGEVLYGAIQGFAIMMVSL